MRKQRATVAATHNGYQLMLDTGHQARADKAREFGGFKGPEKALDMPEARDNRRATFRGFLSGASTHINPGLRSGASLALE